MKIVAPLSGPGIPINQVPDPVFAQKMVGDGMAIDPTDSVLISPIDGTVTLVHASKHAITISHQSGQQVLMHIGIDTVSLKGEGFTAKVKTGDYVRTGQPLIEFDADLLAQKAKSLITMVIVPGESQISRMAQGVLRAGQDVLFESSALTSSPSLSRGVQAESAAVKVHLPAGLHARPASLIAAMAKKLPL
jgi:glucose-specific phosphotransferase system IIA component